MKLIKILCMLISFIFLTGASLAQEKVKDKGVFLEPKNEFYEEMTREIKKFDTKPAEGKSVFVLDFSDYNLPQSIDEFEKQWFNEPISQGQTGTCWSFSTTSFYESEIYRIHKKKFKLSEMYTVYWEYVEKARRFVNERGNSFFAEGSEANAVARIWKKYGIVPSEAYTGLQEEQIFHDHGKMFKEMNDYLIHVKSVNAWNEDEILATIKSIMNHYIGKPPDRVKFDGKEYSPTEYLEEILKLNLDDYVDILSIMQQPYYKKVEYEVPDNWWHSKEYINVPLDEFMKIIRSSIKNGFTICIGGDVSEAGYDSHAEAAVVPTFDIPSEYIDENARQFRFSNNTTTDDHGIHLVGYKNQNGKDWFLIKDSGAGSRNGKNKGFYFYQEDYIKLKIMDFMVHKDAVGDLLKKIEN